MTDQYESEKLSSSPLSSPLTEERASFRHTHTGYTYTLHLNTALCVCVCVCVCGRVLVSSVGTVKTASYSVSKAAVVTHLFICQQVLGRGTGRLHPRLPKNSITHSHSSNHERTHIHTQTHLHNKRHQDTHTQVHAQTHFLTPSPKHTHTHTPSQAGSLPPCVSSGECQTVLVLLTAQNLVWGEALFNVTRSEEHTSELQSR